MNDSNLIFIGYEENTPMGYIYIAVSDKGLCMVNSNSSSIEQFAQEVEEIYPDKEVIFDNNRIKEIRKKIVEYFSYERKKFNIKLDLNNLTDFQRKVLETCSKLDFGETVSYGELALRSGYPNAGRAVGSAMSKNPIAVVIPCHRVIASSGKIGGYSGGLHKKRLLLKLENVVID